MKTTLIIFIYFSKILVRIEGKMIELMELDIIFKNIVGQFYNFMVSEASKCPKQLYVGPKNLWKKFSAWVVTKYYRGISLKIILLTWIYQNTQSFSKSRTHSYFFAPQRHFHINRQLATKNKHFSKIIFFNESSDPRLHFIPFTLLLNVTHCPLDVNNQIKNQVPKNGKILKKIFGPPNSAPCGFSAMPVYVRTIWGCMVMMDPNPCPNLSEPIITSGPFYPGAYVNWCNK